MPQVAEQAHAGAREEDEHGSDSRTAPDSRVASAGLPPTLPRVKPRVLIAALWGVILGLSGLSAYLYVALRRQQAADPVLPPEVAASLTNRPARVRTNAPPIERVVVERLDWRSIESDDYATYIANLRGIGCPEETIRDLVLADVGKVYEAKRRALLPPPRDFAYWLSEGERPDAPERRAEQLATEQAHVALVREEDALLRRLLGATAAELRRREAGPDPRQQANLAFLPEERRAQAAALLGDFDVRIQAVYAEGADPGEAADRVAALEAAREAALADLLGPDELFAYEMLASPLAERLRERLRGFGTTPEEFVALYRLSRGLEAELAELPPDSPDREVRAEAAEAEFEQRLGELLTPPRRADYDRVSDPEYQLLHQLAVDHDLRPDVALDVYQMRETVAGQTARLREDPLLTAEQKRAALAAMRAETERSIAEVLGAPLLELYRQAGGVWLQELTDPAQFAVTPEPAAGDAAGTPPP